MRLDPLVLARAIVAATDPPLPQTSLHELALALSRGEGVARAGRRVCLVLRSIWDADSPGDPDFKPTLVVCTLTTRRTGRQLRTTQQVVDNLVTLSAPGKRPDRVRYGAPCAADDGARVPLGGVCVPELGTEVTTHRGRQVTWYNLHDVPVGSLIYRVDRKGAMVVYQRVGADHWMLMHANGQRDAVGHLPGLLHQIMSEYSESVEGLERLEGEPVLIRLPQAI